MTYRDRIYLCPGDDGEAGRVVDFPAWWDRGAFFERFGHRRIDTGNPIYADDALLLTQAEALAWDRRAREAFARDPRSREPAFAEAMRAFDAALGGAAWMVVESYEWESGMS